MSSKQEVRLGDLITSHNSGIYIKKTLYGRGYPIVGVSDLFKIDTISNQKFPKAPIPPDEFEKYSLEVGDIVYAESSLVRGGIAKCVYVKNIQMPTAFAWHTRRLKTDSNKVLPAWLYFYLESPIARKQIQAVATQTALTGITTKDYFETIVHLPDMSVQSAQAGFLSAVDDKLAAIEAQLAGWREYKLGMMQALFSQMLRFKADGSSDFPDWVKCKLKNVAEIVGGGTPSTTTEAYWADADINWFTPTEMKSKYVNSSKRKISKLGLAKSSAKILPVGSLLLSTRATVGDLSIATQPSATNQGFQSLIVNNKNYNEFWYYWLTFYKNELLRRSSGSTFMEINKTEIGKIPALRPSLPEQQKIANALSTIDAKIEALTHRLEAISEFKRGLLQKMFV